MGSLGRTTFVMAGIKGYRPSAINKRNHEERTGWIPQHDLPSRSTSSGMSAAEVVPGAVLQEVLKEWTERHDRDRDVEFTNTKNGFGPREVQKLSGIQYIASESGVHERAVRAILRGERSFVTLPIAEKLLSAIDREYTLVNGTVPVVPNPTWSQEHYEKFMRERRCY